MAKIALTDEEKVEIIESINNGVEPSPDLLPKLFPLTAERFDIEALDRAKIPTLEYAGKRSKAAILAEATAGIGAAPLQTVRCFGETQEDEWRNMIVQGDNLQFLKTCYKNVDPLIKDKVKGKVKLIYIDPPFGTGDDYGGNDGETSYSAKVAGAEFLEKMRERILFMHKLLAADGSIFVRIDYHFGNELKIILDEIFGRENFKNEIVINRFKRQLRGLKQFNVATDILFFYSKSAHNYFSEIMRGRICSFCGAEKEPEWIPMSSPGIRRPPERTIKGKLLLPPRGRHFTFVQETIDRMEGEGRIKVEENDRYTDLEGNIVTGVPYYLQTEDTPVDSDWTDLRGYVRSKRYPTENPEELLERVIQCTTSEGDLVIDYFAGSGTTSAVAEKLGRRWIMCDFGKHSIYIMQKRMLQIRNVTPFCVVSTGAYDFSHVMDLRKNKDTYIDFVLGLFQLTRDDEKAEKFRLSNIYGLKDGNPVEVYPVWDDEYLKEIRIDEQYLQSILDQTGGSLKGDYFIITPESCTNVGNTTLKNQDGVDVNFKILTFPYKILEDISQKLTLEEQPSSASDINNLLSSTSFYFNEDIEIEIERVDEGLKIAKFETKILDSNKNRFEGLSGLAMLLIDFNYEEGKPFDMDVAVYAKEINEEGVCKVTGLTSSVGVIAIDKHGNESKPYKVE